MIALNDRVCVVTGAAAGIGLGIAEAFAAAGARVAMIDIRTEHVCQEATRLSKTTPGVKGYGLDITDRDDVFSVFSRIRQELGPVYALVNTAGIVDQRPFTEITPEQMDQMMRVNVHGTLYCVQAVADDMKQAQTGRIVNFSSKSGKTGSALMAHYSAAKGAIIALTHSLAFELAPYQVTVNCLCPGIVEQTGVWNQVSSGYVQNLGLTEDEVVKKFTAKVPLGRLAHIQDIVEYVLFLTTSGEYCTGQALNISGGRETH